MKFQYIAVIFVIIILPISLVIGFYTQSQIDIINRQTNYTTKLNSATYDAVKAFQLNTTNSYYSSVSDSKIRDIEASVNSFYNSLTTSLNYTKSELQSFIPAIVYTLYDGYYIYGKRYNTYSDEKINESGELLDMNIDTQLNDANKYEYGLKPFVYYSCRYYLDSQNNFIVNFTLDNFISVYGTIKGNYVARSGYLINVGDCELDENGNVYKYKGATIIERENLKEFLRFSGGEDSGVRDGEYTYVVYQNQKIYKAGDIYFWYNQGEANTITSQEIKNAVDRQTQSAVEYYTDAYNFSLWVNEYLGSVRQDNIRLANDSTGLDFIATEPIFETKNQDPEEESSTFNQHRIAVIKNSIVTNLMIAINSYNDNLTSYEYALPQLTEEDWNKVVNNICVISFMQGLPIGGKYFNNYVVIPNDKNNEFVDIDSVYILTSDGQYHMPNCTQLVENSSYQQTIVGGYVNTSFERQTIDNNYYYKHVHSGNVQNPYTACYYCIVNASGKYDLHNEIFANTINRIENYDISTLRNNYLTFLAREKYNLYKTNN